MFSAFQYPWMLLALWSLPALSLLGWWFARNRQRALVQLAGLVPGVTLARLTPTGRPGLLTSLGLACLVLGMSGPRWGRDWSQTAAPGRDLLVVLDLSRSMFAEAPSRLERAQGLLLGLARGLARRGGHRIGLVLFVGTARLACPLTHDLDHFREVVQSIDLAAPNVRLGVGTRIGSGLNLALQSFQGRLAREILLISDGDDPARDGEWRTAANQAREENIPIHVVGVGDPDEPHRIPEGKSWLTLAGKEVTTRLEEAPLREIARRTNGWLWLPGTRTLEGEELLGHLLQADPEDSPDRLPLLRGRGNWFLLPAFALLLLGMLWTRNSPKRRGGLT